MSKPSVSHIKVTRINQGAVSESDDLLAAEEPLEIRLGYGKKNDRQQKNISVTMRTPGHDFELAAGFLFTEGIIRSAKDIHSIHYCTEANTLLNQENIVRVELNEDVETDLARLQRNFYTTSSCGVCGKESIEAVRTSCTPFSPDPTLIASPELILQLPLTLRKHQSVFEYTGGLHASALFNTKGELLLLREDVGRHNALDKLIGAATASRHLSLPLNNHILLLSGRASFELLQKAAMAGIFMICAVGAPSSLALQIAQEFNITLIGFLRESRFNIYHGNTRIVTSQLKEQP